MARFYKTSLADFSDIGAPTTASRPTGTKQDSPLGSMPVLPEDARAFQDHVSQYEAEINALSSEIQKNPSKTREYEPKIRNLQQRIQQDVNAGPIAAFKNRYNQYSDIKKGVLEVHKDNPYLAQKRLAEITIPDFEYDPDTGTFPRLQSPKTYKEFSDKDIMDYERLVKSSVKDRILSEVEKQGLEISPTQSITELGRMVGITKSDVEAAAIGMLPPQAQAYFEQRNSDYDLGLDERLIIDGQLNRSSSMGRVIDGLGTALSGVKADTKYFTGTDKQKEADISVNTARRKKAFSGSGKGKGGKGKAEVIYDVLKGVAAGTTPASKIIRVLPAREKEEANLEYFNRGGEIYYRYNPINEDGDIELDGNGNEVVREGKVDLTFIDQRTNEGEQDKLLKLFTEDGTYNREEVELEFNGVTPPNPVPRRAAIIRKARNKGANQAGKTKRPAYLQKNK